MFDRAKAIHEAFLTRVAAGDLPRREIGVTAESVGLTPADLVRMTESQMMSRHLDLISRRIKGESFYSIGSSGHEGNAAIAAALRLDDMAFLHYRSAAFQIERTRSLPGTTPLWDMMLSFVASSEDPVSGGRHKVLGGKAIFVPPQTSTIASHLPKAVGAAHSLGLARRILDVETELPKDAIILCSFGDASANHSTAQGAFNTAAWAAHQGAAMPLIFLCEDNGIGISVPTPKDWIRTSFEQRAGLTYMTCDGRDLIDTYRAATEAARIARRRRCPVFLHMRTVRLMGHAGSDIEAGYRSMDEIQATEAQDPLLYSASLLIEHGILTAEQILDLYIGIEAQVARIADNAIPQPKLSNAREIMASLIPRKRGTTPPLPSAEDRTALFAKDTRTLEQPQPLARNITLALSDLMLQYQNMVVFGEDVGRKGGVYSVTTGLYDKFGSARVIDTLLDEQSILGQAIGLAHNGFLPVPEIQFLAYVHNAEDQIRGEAATLPFFSNGQFDNPMVIRIAGLAYQRGFGGHFHNDNSFAIFRDIPGIILACPSNGADAVRMLRECVRLAHQERRVVVFLEPIALYTQADLHAPDDKGWLCPYAAPGTVEDIPFGEIGVHGSGTDLCILTYGNGYYLSRKAAKTLETEHGVKLRVVDLRWLTPLNEEAIWQAVAPCRSVLIVDECRRTGSLSEELMVLLLRRGLNMPLARIAAEDSFIPLGPAAYHVLPSVEDIEAQALQLVRTPRASVQGSAAQ